jgi:hypothetical protein
MRRTTVWLSIVVLALATSASPAFAIKPSAKPPKPTVAKTQAPKSTVKAPKPANASAPKAAKAPKAANASAPKAAKASAPKSAKNSMTTTTLPPPNTPTTLNPIAQKLQGKPNQLARLESALGLGTLTPEQLNGATSGFKNFGQVNAATNTVLHNPTVTFADLKALMTGLDMKGQPVPGQTTTYSLGQAKQRLGIADGDDSQTAPTTTSSTTTKAKKRTTTSGGTH